MPHASYLKTSVIPDSSALDVARFLRWRSANLLTRTAIRLYESLRTVAGPIALTAFLRQRRIQPSAFPAALDALARHGFVVVHTADDVRSVMINPVPELEAGAVRCVPRTAPRRVVLAQGLDGSRPASDVSEEAFLAAVSPHCSDSRLQTVLKVYRDLCATDGSFVISRCGMKAVTAQNALSTLESAGLIRQIGKLGAVVVFPVPNVPADGTLGSDENSRFMEAATNAAIVMLEREIAGQKAEIERLIAFHKALCAYKGIDAGVFAGVKEYKAARELLGTATFDDVKGYLVWFVMHPHDFDQSAVKWRIESFGQSLQTFVKNYGAIVATVQGSISSVYQPGSQEWWKQPLRKAKLTEWIDEPAAA